MTQTPTDALRLVPVDLISDTMNAMARAYERIHSMPRVSDTELAKKVDEAKERLRPYLAAPASPLPGGGLEPLENDPAVAALCDSNYRAGALAGWNAANHSDPAEGERIMAHIREVEPGSLAPILERNRLRKLPAAPTGAK